ncbi:hypothetical protein ACTVPS_01690 [Serratia marcescens]|uniref:hypothetical protein n=1 Tax=Serratia marcescens TaxID=615 RepID=UPI003FA6BD5F
MTRTLTTEQLRARAESLGLNFFIEQRAGVWVKEWFNNGCTSATAEEVMMWSMLANREAQPVAELVYSSAMPRFIGDTNEVEGYRCWIHGETRLVPTMEQAYADAKAVCTAPPAPAYPERLPCPVHLLPGLKFGKGVPTLSMLDALVRRAEYEADLEAMTPEQKAENDARLEKLKALIPQPSLPAVPDEIGAQEAKELFNYLMTEEEINATVNGYNARCAEMLAQPVSGGYKLVPVEPTAEMINAALASGALSIRTVYRVMLAAAPEGGNEN